MSDSFESVIAGIVTIITIVAGIATILEYLKKHPYSAPTWLRRPLIKKYLQAELNTVGNLLASGTRNLYVKDILSNTSLFIQPRWAYYFGESGGGDLVDTLIGQIEGGKRALLLGEPGLGKSTILKKVYREMVLRYSQKKSHKIPVYIRLREVAYSTNEPISLERLWQFLVQNRINPFKISLKKFCELAKTGQLILLLDGLDEAQGVPSQTSVNNLANSEIFRVCNILTCRIYFFETYLRVSNFDALYPGKFRLKNIKFTRDVEEFSRAFLRCEQRPNTPTLLSMVKKHAGLSEISKRPLLLVMILDILAESPELDHAEWTMASLYERYTLKWLDADLGKPGNIIKPIDKHRFMEDVAWAMTRESNFDADADANFSISITRTALIGLLGMFKTQPIGQLYLEYPLEELLEDVLQYTFLYSMLGTDHYFFSHKTFQEFYAAKYVFRALNADSAQAKNALRQHLSVEIAGILKDLLRARSLSEKDRRKIETHLEMVYRENTGEDNILLREQACYYLACLGSDSSVKFLENAIEKEPDLFVQRGIWIGLGVLCKKQEAMDRYLAILHTDGNADSINIGYHLIYYGDTPFEPTYYDKGQRNCTGTVSAILRHFETEKNMFGWSLDMLTLRRLVETRGIEVLGQEQLNKLGAFMETQKHQTRPSFRNEYLRLQNTLKEHLQ